MNGGVTHRSGTQIRTGWGGEMMNLASHRLVVLILGDIQVEMLSRKSATGAEAKRRELG